MNDVEQRFFADAAPGGAWSLPAFFALVLLVAAQRVLELRKSAKNEARLLAAGGRTHADGQASWMRLMHTAWFVAMLVEVVVLDRPFLPVVSAVAFAVFAAGQALRLAAMHALGDRWTVTVVTLPGVRAVDAGVFRYVRHPNYLGVVLEIAALPLVHGAWLTSITFTVMNALFLRARIRAEEAALREDSGYDDALGSRPRFVPTATTAARARG
jgi:methyltransferase